MGACLLDCFQQHRKFSAAGLKDLSAQREVVSYSSRHNMLWLTYQTFNPSDQYISHSVNYEKFPQKFDVGL
jgi:hypothetical protein